jgi:hypothetical protein
MDVTAVQTTVFQKMASAIFCSGGLHLVESQLIFIAQEDNKKHLYSFKRNHKKIIQKQQFNMGTKPLQHKVGK